MAPETLGKIGNTVNLKKAAGSFFLFCSVAAALGVSLQTQAATDAAAKTPNGGNVLWDEWYTVTLNGKIHYGYYNDKAELKNDQIFVKNDYWKQEEGYINIENLGALAQNNDELSPILFNFHSVYRTTETTIDGSVKNEHFLSVRVRKGDQQLPMIERTIPKKTFLTALFSVWLEKHFPVLTEGKTLEFSSISEDDIDRQFQVTEGSVKALKPDAFASSTNSKMLQVFWHGSNTTWWINSKGVVQKISMPDQNVLVERVPQKQAKKFLDGGP